VTLLARPQPKLEVDTEVRGVATRAAPHFLDPASFPERMIQRCPEAIRYQP